MLFVNRINKGANKVKITNFGLSKFSFMWITPFPINSDDSSSTDFCVFSVCYGVALLLLRRKFRFFPGSKYSSLFQKIYSILV